MACAARESSSWHILAKCSFIHSATCQKKITYSSECCLQTDNSLCCSRCECADLAVIDERQVTKNDSKAWEIFIRRKYVCVEFANYIYCYKQKATYKVQALLKSHSLHKLLLYRSFFCEQLEVSCILTEDVLQVLQTDRVCTRCNLESTRICNLFCRKYTFQSRRES